MALQATATLSDALAYSVWLPNATAQLVLLLEHRPHVSAHVGGRYPFAAVGAFFIRRPVVLRWRGRIVKIRFTAFLCLISPRCIGGKGFLAFLAFKS